MCRDGIIPQFTTIVCPKCYTAYKNRSVWVIQFNCFVVQVHVYLK